MQSIESSLWLESYKKLEDISGLEHEVEPLVDCFAIYGVSEEKINENKQKYYQGELIFSDNEEGEIIKHTANLVFPKGIESSTFNN